MRLEARVGFILLNVYLENLLNFFIMELNGNFLFLRHSFNVEDRIYSPFLGYRTGIKKIKPLY